MEKVIVIAKNAPAAIGPYSHAVKADGILYSSGQIPLDPVSGQLVGNSIESQTEQVMRNVSAILSQEGLTFSDIVKTTVFMTDLNDFARFNAVYARFFPNDPPARSCVQVAALPKGSLVEIEFVAHL